MWQGSGEPGLSAAVGRGGPGADGVGKSPVSMQMWAGVSPASGACCVTHSPCEFCCASNAALAAGNPRRLVYRRGRLGRESGVTGVVDRYHVDCSKQTANRTNKQTNAAAPTHRNGNAATAGRRHSPTASAKHRRSRWPLAVRAAASPSTTDHHPCHCGAWRGRAPGSWHESAPCRARRASTRR